MRKLRLAAAVSLALASPGVFALGLGDIEMRSALNQPMNAEIRLTSVKPGELDGMIVKLASADAFARAGIERSQVLQALRFEVDAGSGASGGTPVIRITSNTPVVEPFLNFLLEVDWPQGRMVREYTVLLDPPVFMNPSASGSSALGDSASLGSREDSALVAPAPIDRTDNSAAAVADSFEVELVGSGRETADGGVGGDIVSLDELDADAALLPPGDAGAPLAGGDGEIVSLTDLEQPNTAAEAARAEADEFAFDVELMGSGVEVDDGAVVADAAGVAAAGGASASGADDGEIVSLEELDAAPAAGGSTDASSGTGGAERSVAEGDTLFEIAADAAGDEVSVEQMMLALLAANKAAFIEGNINLVRAGSILRVPDASEARALTQAQAVAEVGKQARLWQEYRDGLRSSGGTRLATTDEPAAEPADATTDATTDASTDGGTENTESALSADARAILEDARQEILDRESLRIVGEGSSSTTVATAGDARDGDDSARLGDIQQRLTLAREELSSTRLEAADLDDQAGELRSTTENFDALIALRENDIAALEARLAESRNAAGNAADAAGDAASEAGDALADGATAMEGAAGDALADASDAAADAGDATRNALSDAGQALESVELVDGDAEGALDAAGNAVDSATDAGAQALADGTEAVGDASDAAADAAAGLAAGGADALAEDRPWYQTLMADPKRLAIVGVGGLAALGALGTLLWRRRRASDDDAWLADEDDVEFVDGDGVDTFTGGVNDAVDGARTSVSGGAKGVAAGAAAGVGVAGAAVAGAFDRDESRVEATDRAVDDAVDDTLAFGATAPGQDGDEGLDKDDTISEVDVYLAYGLHGQAEELLGRAIDRDPNNPVYARKLLETHHAQGNGEAYESAAEDFHARFGGDSNPDWPAIAAMGNELKPQSPLFAGAAAEVDRVGSDGFGTDRFDDGDFSGATDPTAASSVSRDFDGAGDQVSFDDPATDAGRGAADDETALMDQSLDPAFAFDESDLEATGDFSKIADEVASESDDGIIDFPALDAVPSSDAPIERARDAAASAMDAVEFDAGDMADLGDRKDSASGALAGGLAGGAAAAGAAGAAAAAGAGTLADDLTLDLDQLSDELELDSTELLDDPFADLAGSDIGAVETLEMPDLTADNDLLSGGAADVGDADEVDTMMDLAKAYIDMGDKDSASSTLGEIVKSGTPDQVNEAETLLRKIS